jgi:hypothetical protein
MDELTIKILLMWIGTHGDIEPFLAIREMLPPKRGII